MLKEIQKGPYQIDPLSSSKGQLKISNKMPFNFWQRLMYFYTKQINIYTYYIYSIYQWVNNIFNCIYKTKQKG